MKRFLAVLCVVLLVLSLTACERKESPSSQKESGSPSVSGPASAPDPSSPEPSSAGSKPEGSDPPESQSSSEEPEPEPAPPQTISGSELIQLPAVPHGAELEAVDFSAMDKNELVELLQPVLDRAEFFCKFGWMDRLDSELGIKVDFSPEEAIEVPVQGFDFNKSFYPCLNLPYQTVEEFRQDIGTVFTPDVSEEHLQIIFNHYIDHEDRLYVEGGDGYSVHRNWKPNEMSVVTAGKNTLTISAPVSMSGPSADEFFTASLNSEIMDGYIVMDGSYFARNDGY